MIKNRTTRVRVSLVMVLLFIFSMVLPVMPVGSLAMAEEAVNIQDKNLEAAIRNELEKPGGAITVDDMGELISLNGHEADIENLTGLEYAVNLTQLNMVINRISDISPLSDLKNLKELNLWNNNISDISSLSGLENLRKLILGENKISDISSLSDLENLQELSLTNNEISNITSLSDLKKLEWLILNGNKLKGQELLSELIKLESWENLKALGIGVSELNDISPIAPHENLELLDIRFNQINDLTPLTGITSLKELYLQHNEINDISPLLSLENLFFIDLRNNFIDISDGSESMLIIKGFKDNNVYVDYEPQREPPKEEGPPGSGDVTGGGVDVSDAIEVLRSIVGLTSLTEKQIAAADVNQDGKIDVSDAITILRYIVGLIDSLPLPGENIQLSFATFWPALDFQVEEGHKAWASEISERVSAETSHTVEFNWHYSGFLLQAPELYAGAASGIADIVSTCPSYTPHIFPVTGAFELPGYNNDNALVSSVTIHEAWKQSEIIQQEYEDVKVMHFWATGPGDFITNTPVRKMEDFDGLRIRAVGNTIPWLDALGAEPVLFPMAEFYGNIEAGVVDGLLSPTDVLKEFRLAEVTQYITKSPPAYNIVFTKVMNYDTWNSLPASVQEIFDAVNEEYVIKYGKMRADYTMLGQEYAVEEYGHEIIELDADEYQRWVDLAGPIYDAWIQYTDDNFNLDMSGEDIINMIRGFDETYSELYGDYYRITN